MVAVLPVEKNPVGLVLEEIVHQRIFAAIHVEMEE